MSDIPLTFKEEAPEVRKEREDQLHDLLLKDQCHASFDHTQTLIVEWLTECTAEGIQNLYTAVGELLREKRAIERI